MYLFPIKEIRRIINHAQQWMLRRQNLMKDKAHRVNIYLDSVRLMLPSLWCHVGDMLSTFERFGTCTLFDEFGNPKVPDFERIAFNQDVVRFYVPMYEFLVDRPSTLRDVNHHLKGPRKRN